MAARVMHKRAPTSPSTACIRAGEGAWLASPHIQPAYANLPEVEWFADADGSPLALRFRDSKHFPGKCGGGDGGRRANATRFTWEPSGTSCSALRRGRERLPPLRQLASEFCAHARQLSRPTPIRLLFVGDSMMSTLFVSLVAALGGRELRYANTSEQPCLDRDRIRTDLRRHVGPLDHSSSVCAGGVSARFIRNERLIINDTTSARLARWRGSYRSMCGWSSAAAEAHVVVLNRGAHYEADSVFEPALDWTLRAVTKGGVSARSGAAVTAGGASSRGRRPSPAVVYISSSAAIPDCERYDDPQSQPLTVAPTAPNHWGSFASQNGIASRLAEKHGAAFLNVYTATALRPGGRMPDDCLHFCAPGPVDDWARLLLAYLDITIL